MRFWKTLLTGLALATLTACTDTEPAAVTDVGVTSTAGSSRVAIPPDVRRTLGMTFAPVQVRDVRGTIRVPGAFESQPRARHEYRMTLPGRVTLQVDQYEHVEPGTVLYRYQSPSWSDIQHEIIESEQTIASAEARLAVAEAAVDEARAHRRMVSQRIEALAAADFKRADLQAEADRLDAQSTRLEADVQLAETILTNARLTREHALHRAWTAVGLTEDELLEEVVPGVPHYRTVEWLEVRAVEAGVVERFAVTNGAYVESPELVLSTIDPSRVRFRAVGLQSDLAKLNGKRTGRIIPPRFPNTDVGQAVDADVTLGLEADPNQRTITLIAEPRVARPWARPGVSGFLEISTTSSRGPVLAVPRGAVVRDGLRDILFVLDPKDPNQVIRIDAYTGADDGQWIEIRGGLPNNAEVVLDGVYELKLATTTMEPAKGGHFHADGTFHEGHH